MAAKEAPTADDIADATALFSKLSIEQRDPALAFEDAKKNELENAFRAHLKQLGVAEGVAKVEHWPNPGKEMAGTLEVLTNMCEVTQKNASKTIHQYEVEIIGVRRVHRGDTVQERLVFFTSNGPDEFRTLERHDVCARVFQELRDIHNPTFNRCYYDYASAMYSPDKLKDIVYVIQYDQMANHQAFQDDAALRVAFRNIHHLRVSIKHRLEFSVDMSSINQQSEVDESDQQLVRFLDIASSTDIADQPNDFTLYKSNIVYYIHSEHYNWDADKLTLPYNVNIWPGISKTHRLIEGGKAAVIIQPKLTPFHIAERADIKMRSMIAPPRGPPHYAQALSMEQQIAMFKGVYVIPVHLFEERTPENQRVYMVKVVGFGLSSKEEMFDHVDHETKRSEKISVADYFRRYHNRALQYPELPTLKCRQGRQPKQAGANGKKTKSDDQDDMIDESTEPCFNYYPPEVCQIVEGQRVKTGALNQGLTKATIDLARMQPNELKQHIDTGIRALSLPTCTAFDATGFQAADKLIELNVPVLSVPSISFNNENRELDLAQATWRTKGTTYYRAAKSVRWAFYVVCRGRMNTAFDHKAFLAHYKNIARDHGLQLGDPIEVDVLDDTSRNATSCIPLGDKMDALLQKEVEFILAITIKADTQIHSILKAYEQQTGIITQNVTVELARKAIGQDQRGGGQGPRGGGGGQRGGGPGQRGGPGGGVQIQTNTFENIVNKTNIKLGGLNYKLLMKQKSALDKNDLFIGFAIDLAAGGLGDVDAQNISAPTVLAFAANDGQEPEDFTGDWAYQKSSTAADLPTLQGGIDEILKRYKKAHNGKSAKRVILYQVGSSEGQYGYVFRFYVPLVFDLVKKAFGESVTFVYIMCSRLHNARFWPKHIPPQTRPKEQNLPLGTVIDHRVTRPNVPEFYLASHRALMGTSVLPKYSVLFNNDEKLTLREIEELTLTLAFDHQIINMPIGLPAPARIAREFGKRGRNVFKATCNHHTINDCYVTDADVTRLDWTQVTQRLSLQGQTELRNRRINA